jgi:hypothetical protein
VRRHWWHCAETFHGMAWTARRVVPLCPPEEPRTPRLCVASSVARCFAARLFVTDVYAYRTAKPRSALPPRGVWDSRVTQERWIVPPVEMECVMCLPFETVWRACEGTYRRVEKTMSASWETRIRALGDATEALGPELSSRGDREFVARMLEFIDERAKKAS